MIAQNPGNKARLQGVLAVVKQVVVSNEIRTHSMQHSSVVLCRSVLQRRLGSSFSPEAGAPFFAGACAASASFSAQSGQRLSIKKLCTSWGISSREGESSLRRQRAPNSQWAKLRDCHFDFVSMPRVR
jgi:hypothetical protein